MKPIFRSAVPADVPAMANVLTLAWQNAYRGILSDARLDGIRAEERAERLRVGIETHLESHYYVLEADGEIAGVSVVRPCRDSDLSGAAEIQVFYIHPARQRQGLGRRLMAHTLAEIGPCGCIALWVLRDNHSARAFFERMGFRPDGLSKSLESLENAVAVRYRYAGASARTPHPVP